MEEGGRGNTASPASVVRRRSVLPWLVLFAMIALNLGVRVRLASTPLERDEGEYAYAGQLILTGVPPYLHAYNMKFPGTYLAYAAMMAVFGQSAAGVHLGMAVATSVNLLLIFLLARKWWGDVGGVPAAIVFGLLQLDVRPLTLSGHATHLVVLAGLAGLVVMTAGAARRLWQYLLAGVCFGLAILAKQPGTMFVLTAGLWLLCDCVARRVHVRSWLARSAVLAIGCCIPLGLTILWLWHGHALAGAKYWTIDYARAYGSETTLRQGLGVLALAVPYVTTDSRWLWALGLLGLTVLWLMPGRRLLAMKLWILTAFSFAAVSAGFWYRPHYFILLMPAVALGAGAFNVAVIEFAGDRVWLRRARFVVYLGVAGLFIASQATVWFVLTPQQVCRAEYGDEAFISAVDVGNYLRAHSNPADTIVVYGSEPEIYFYARRRSATGYLYMYPLIENQPFADTMQHAMAREIEAAAPRFMVLVPNGRTLGVVPPSRRWLFDWWKQYLVNYRPVANVEEPPFGPPTADGPEVITILKRRGT